MKEKATIITVKRKNYLPQEKHKNTVKTKKEKAQYIGRDAHTMRFREHLLRAGERRGGLAVEHSECTMFSVMNSEYTYDCIPTIPSHYDAQHYPPTLKLGAHATWQYMAVHGKQ